MNFIYASKPKMNGIKNILDKIDDDGIIINKLEK